MRASKPKWTWTGNAERNEGLLMDRLIREMSYLFTKSRFDELQERAEGISIEYQGTSSVSVW